MIPDVDSQDISVLGNESSKYNESAFLSMVMKNKNVIHVEKLLKALISREEIQNCIIVFVLVSLVTDVIMHNIQIFVLLAILFLKFYRSECTPGKDALLKESESPNEAELAALLKLLKTLLANDTETETSQKLILEKIQTMCGLIKKSTEVKIQPQSDGNGILDIKTKNDVNLQVPDPLITDMLEKGVESEIIDEFGTLDNSSQLPSNSTDSGCSCTHLKEFVDVDQPAESSRGVCLTECDVVSVQETGDWDFLNLMTDDELIGSIDSLVSSESEHGDSIFCAKAYIEKQRWHVANYVDASSMTVEVDASLVSIDDVQKLLSEKYPLSAFNVIPGKFEHGFFEQTTDRECTREATTEMELKQGSVITNCGTNHTILSGRLRNGKCLTVGHLYASGSNHVDFSDTNADIFDDLHNIGHCESTLDFVDVQSPDGGLVRTTADLAFLHIVNNHLVGNTLTFEDGSGRQRSCELRLSRNVPANERVMIIDRFNDVKLGYIKHVTLTRCGRGGSQCTIAECCHNVMTINDIQNLKSCRNSEITSRGDSGALVTSFPKTGSNGHEYVDVYGMVIGVLNHMHLTVANRLWDVLQHNAGLQNATNPLDFSRPVRQDSGVFCRHLQKEICYSRQHPD